MENNSPSPTSHASATLFARNGFSPLVTILTLLGAVGILTVVIFVAVGVWLFGHGFDLVGLSRTFSGLYGVEIQSLGEVIVIAYLLALLPAIARSNLRDIGFRTPTGRDWLLTLGAIVAMFVIVTVLGSLFETALHVKTQEEAVQVFLKMHGFQKVLFAAFAVVVGPATEEFIFRLLLFNAMRAWWGFWPGAIVSSILFGAAHWQPGGWAVYVTILVPLAIGGLILCYVYDRTRNAWSNIITHACFNGLSLVAILVAPQLAK